MGRITGRWDTLEDALQVCWKMLERGASRFKDPFHRPVLGTTCNGEPRSRSVILRQCIVSDRLLVCYTDARAGKVREIRCDNRVSWHFYHPKKRMQLRVHGLATLHSDDSFADQQWAIVRIPSRLNYGTTDAPGTPIEKPTTGLPDFIMYKLPTLLQSEKFRKNFMVIACRIDAMDWLRLCVTGNRRARFEWTESGKTATWLIP